MIGEFLHSPPADAPCWNMDTHGDSKGKQMKTFLRIQMGFQYRIICIPIILEYTVLLIYRNFMGYFRIIDDYRIFFGSWPAILFGDSSDSSSPKADSDMSFFGHFLMLKLMRYHVFSYRHISPFIWDESEFSWKNRTVSPSNGKVSARCSPWLDRGHLNWPAHGVQGIKLQKVKSQRGAVSSWG